MFKLFQNPSHTLWIPLTTFTNNIFTAAAKNRHNKACTRNGWQEYSCSCCSIGSTGCKDIHLPLYSKLQPRGKCEFLIWLRFFLLAGTGKINILSYEKFHLLSCAKYHKRNSNSKFMYNLDLT